MSFPQQSGMNLGVAYGQIVITSDGVEQTANKISTSLGQSLQSIGSQIQSLGTNLTVLTAPLLGFGVAGVKASADFEDSLKQIEVRAGLTADELAKVEQKSIDIGRSSIYGPGQAAEAFLQLLTTGMDVSEAMETIDTVIAGAAASGADLAFVADGLTDIMAGFQLEVSASDDVMQTLVDSTGASSATLDSMVAAMANVAPVANVFGFSVEETSAALAVLHENGIKGAEAGSSLKSAFLNLSRPTDEVQGLLDELGVTLTDMDGNFKDLDTIIDDLNIAMTDMTESERQEALTKLGGSYGVVGLSALMASDGIDQMVDSMNQQADITDIADSRLDTFNGQVSFLQGSLELLMIRALQPLINNALRPLVEWAAMVINQIEAWITANPLLAEKIVQFLAVITALGPALVIVGTVISAIGGALAALMSPIGLVIGAVAALTLAWQTNFAGIRDVVNDVWTNTLAPAFKQFFEWLNGGEGGDVGAGIMGVIQDIATYLIQVGIPAIANFVAWFITQIPVAFEFLKTAWETVLLPAFAAIGTFITDTVLPALSNLYNWFVVTGLPAINTFITETAMQAIQGFIDILFALWNDVQPFLQQLYDWFIVSGLPLIKSYISDVVVPGFQFFIDLIAGIWEVVSPVLQSLYDWFITTGLPAIMGFLENTVTPAIQGFIDLLAGIWVTVQPGIDLLKTGLQTAFNIIEGAIQAVLNLINSIGGAMQNAANSVQSAANTISNVANAPGQAVSNAQGLGSQIGQIANLGAKKFGGLFGFAQGTNYIDKDMIAQLHAGEAVVPAHLNPYNPNAEMNGLTGSSGTTFTFENIVIQANDRQGGQEAADGFMQRLEQKITERGGI